MRCEEEVELITAAEPCRAMAGSDNAGEEATEGRGDVWGSLTLVAGSETKLPKKIDLTLPWMVIGRGEGNNVRMELPYISHRHCRIDFVASEGAARVTDHSSNGTFVNKQALATLKDKCMLMRHGDLLHLFIPKPKSKTIGEELAYRFSYLGPRQEAEPVVALPEPTASTALSALLQELDDFRAREVRLNAQVDKLSKANSELTAKTERVEKDRSILSSDCHDLHEKVFKLEAEALIYRSSGNEALEEIRGALKDAEEKYAQQGIRKAELEAQLAGMRHEMDEAVLARERRIKALQSEGAEQEQKIAVNVARAEKAEREMRELKLRLQEMEQSEGSLRAQLAHAESSEGASKQALLDIQIALQELQRAKADVDGRLSKAESQLAEAAAHQDDISHLTVERDELLAERARRVKQCEELHARLEDTMCQLAAANVVADDAKDREAVLLADLTRASENRSEAVKEVSLAKSMAAEITLELQEVRSILRSAEFRLAEAEMQREQLLVKLEAAKQQLSLFQLRQSDAEGALLQLEKAHLFHLSSVRRCFSTGVQPEGLLEEAGPNVKPACTTDDNLGGTQQQEGEVQTEREASESPPGAAIPEEGSPPGDPVDEIDFDDEAETNYTLAAPGRRHENPEISELSPAVKTGEFDVEPCPAGSKRAHEEGGEDNRRSSCGSERRYMNGCNSSTEFASQTSDHTEEVVDDSHEAKRSKLLGTP